MNYINVNVGFYSIIITAALAVVTWYYATLTHKLSKNSSKAIDQTSQIIENSRNEQRNIKNNYLYLLNGEIYMNSISYATIVFYISIKKEKNIKEIFSFLPHNDFSQKSVAKALIKDYTRLNIWDEIKNECAKHLPNDLMEELVGYYLGVQNSKTYSFDCITSEGYVEFAKGQLVSSLKCFNLFDKEGVKLRRQEIYEFDNYTYKIDKKSGDLIPCLSVSTMNVSKEIQGLPNINDTLHQLVEKQNSLPDEAFKI